MLILTILNKRFCSTSLFLIVFISSCNNSTHKDEQKSFNKEKVKNQFVKANQQVVLKESDEMDYYQKSHKMPFVKTNVGIRYYVYKPSVKGDSLKNDDIVRINYTIEDQQNILVSVVKKKGKAAFTDVFQHCVDRYQAIVTFLALLELLNLEVFRLISGDGLNSFWIEPWEEVNY